MPSIPKHPLKILVVGGGGREHALCWKLAQSEHVQKIFCAPGNGGTATEAKTTNVAIDQLDFASLADFALQEKIDLTVIGPEIPLAEGIVDFFQNKKLRVFGPKKSAARLEWSKAYAKTFMTQIGIPTPRYLVCNSLAEAKKQLDNNAWAQVVKLDGLAAGKGVIVCDSKAEVIQVLEEIFEKNKFGSSGQTVLLEDKIVGEELSLLLLCDGKRFYPLEASQDHKRRFDGESGPNTGGMGAYSPVSLYAEYRREIEENIIAPLQTALDNKTLDYQGLLYVGIMIGKVAGDTKNRAQVIEFNSRFGDPEIQAVLPRMTSDLLIALWAATEGTLNEIELTWTDKPSCCVVAVTKAYPEKSSAGESIKLSSLKEDSFLFHSGTKSENGQLFTNGGRILCATALGNNLEKAAERAYEILSGVSFPSMDYRHDITKERSKCR